MKMCKVCKKNSTSHRRDYACPKCWGEMTNQAKQALLVNRKSLSVRG